MTTQWERPTTNAARTLRTAVKRLTGNRSFVLKLGAAFGLLITILIGIGILGLSRMDQVNANLEYVIGRRWNNLQLARQALTYSNQNSRITLEIFLLNDRGVIEPLLATRAENTNKISQLVDKLQSQCDSAEECRLLAAVNETRAPYVDSYLRALHLLVDENQAEAGRVIMVQEMIPALNRYHAAWSQFMQFQMAQMDKAAKESTAHYRHARIIVAILVALAVLVAVAIASLVTRKLAKEMRTRLLAEHALGKLNTDLERRVEQRTEELARSNQQLTDEIAERKVAEGRSHLQAAALQAAANSIVITDVKGNILWVNSAFTRLTGYSAQEVMGQNPRVLRSGKHDGSFYANLWKTITSGEVWHGEVTNRRKDGSYYDEEMTITPVRAENGEITHFVAIKQDITSRRAVAKALMHAEEKYRAIVEDAVVGIYQVTPDGKFLSANRALAKAAGYDSPQDFLNDVTNAAQMYVDPKRREELRRLMAADGKVQDFEIVVRTRSRQQRTVLVNARAVRSNAGVDLYYEGTLQDITDRKAAEQQVQYLAYYDGLTGLPNRTLFQDRLAKALAGARRRGENLALLFLDLDDFKKINDSLGHSAGDLLLKEVAERLKKWAREQDTIARLGGDEFVVILTGLRDAAGAALAADRLMNAMGAQFVIQGQVLSVSCSVGISVFPNHGRDGEALVKNADAAMYSAKELGRNNFRFFTQEMNRQAMERLTLESKLRQAIQNKELYLVYQPQWDLAAQKITGAEALLRWRHPLLGLIPPDKFIPIAENCGLIMPMGEWVLKTACAQARQWQDEGLPPMTVSVNVSAVQFRQETFPALIRRVLQETGLSAQYLELELTEGLLLSNVEVTHSVLRELEDMGVKLSIDDFGTGYSSLSYLKHLPVYKLKIDRSFVRDITVDPDDAAITGTIISMAKSLDLKVIAEGVENEEQMLFLREHACDEIQGYYFSRPLSVEDFSEKVRTSLQSDLQATTAAHNDSSAVRHSEGNPAPSPQFAG